MRKVHSGAKQFGVQFQVHILMLFHLVAWAARAQGAGTGSIQGTGSDTTGAIVRDAVVPLTKYRNASEAFDKERREWVLHVPEYGHRYVFN